MVDCDSLENCCAFTGTGGSNPSLSAKEKSFRMKGFFYFMEPVKRMALIKEK